MESRVPIETVMSFVDHEPELMASLTSHLESHYSIQVTELIKLDIGVYHVKSGSNPSWVARVFPLSNQSTSPSSVATTASSLATLLSFLKRHGYPAERCAAEDPVSQFQRYEVLVTDFVGGAPPKICAETFRKLGDLLGRLQSLRSERDEKEGGGEVIDWKGGSWHHLSSFGGVADEIAAAEMLLSQAKSKAPTEQHAPYEDLARELESLKSFTTANLPETIVHPDLVPINIIESSEGSLVAIDWTGSGLGLRVFSLAWLLWAAYYLSRRMTMVKAVIEGYRHHIFLEPAELAHFPAAIITRPLTLATWEVCHGRRDIEGVVQRVPHMRKLAEEIAHSARETFTETAQQALIREESRSLNQDDNSNPSKLVQTTNTPELFPVHIRAQETSRSSIDRLFSDPIAQLFIDHFQYIPPASTTRAEALRKLVLARTLFFDSLLHSFCVSVTTNSTTKNSQIVLLGASYDARAFRLTFLSPAVTVFEIDYASVFEAKQVVLSSSSVQGETTASTLPAALCHRITVSTDPRSPHEWPTRLAAAGFQSDCPTAWIADGTMLDLDRETIKQALKVVTALSVNRHARLGIDVPNIDGDERGDPVLWLKELGWIVEVSDTRKVLRSQGRGAQAERRGGPRGGGEDREGGSQRPKVIFLDAIRVDNDAA